MRSYSFNLIVEYLNEEEDAMTLVCKNIYSFLYLRTGWKSCIWETVDSYDWYHIFFTHEVIRIFRPLLHLASLTGTWHRVSSRPKSHSAPSRLTSSRRDLSTLLTALPDWPPLIDWLRGSKNFCHYITFWHPHLFPSGTIYVIHFHCHFISFKTQLHILFIKSTLNGCQKSICYTIFYHMWKDAHEISVTTTRFIRPGPG